MTIQQKSVSRSKDSFPSFVYKLPVKIAAGLFVISALFYYKTRAKKIQSTEEKNQILAKKFEPIALIAQSCEEKGLSPKIKEINFTDKKVEFEKVRSIPWLSYQTCPESYRAAMKTLKAFHLALKPTSNKSNSYAPYNFLLNVTQGNRDFTDAFLRISLIIEKLKPWLQKNATVCNGAFCTQNLSLRKEGGEFKTFITKVSACTIGDPYLDIAYFSQGLKENEKNELLTVYLNDIPNDSEKAHLKLMDFVLYLVTAVVRYRRGQEYKHVLNTFLGIHPNEFMDLLEKL